MKCNISGKANYFQPVPLEPNMLNEHVTYWLLCPVASGGHKCPAYHNTHLHSSCKSGPSLESIHSLFITQDEKETGCLTGGGDLVPHALTLLHTWLDLLHAPRDLESGWSPPACEQMATIPCGKAILCEKEIRLPPGCFRQGDGQRRPSGAVEILVSTLESNWPEFEATLSVLLRWWMKCLTSLSFTFPLKKKK